MDLFLNPPDDKRYELVRGQLVEKHMATLSVWVASQIYFVIRLFLQKNDLGWATTELPIACFPWLGRHGRRPDVAYFAYERCSGPEEDPVTVAPNLIVEVLSPNDEVADLDEKIEEYFKAGVQIVWIVNPFVRTTRILRADGTGSGILHEADRISGETVLPGFESLISEFFPKKRKA